MAFIAIGVLELVHSFNIKSEQSIFKVGIFENKFLIGSFILGVLVQTIVVIIPTLANIFKLVPLNQTQWIITILISILPIPIMEIQKKVNEIKKEERKPISKTRVSFNVQELLQEANKTLDDIGKSELKVDLDAKMTSKQYKKKIQEFVKNALNGEELITTEYKNDTEKIINTLKEKSKFQETQKN